MSDLGAVAEEHGAQASRSPIITGDRSQKFPAQALTLTFAQQTTECAGELRRAITSKLDAWDLVLPVGPNSFTVTFERDDPSAAKTISQQILKTIEEVSSVSCQSLLINIVPKDGKLSQTILMENGETTTKLNDALSSDDKVDDETVADNPSEDGPSSGAVATPPLETAHLPEFDVGYAPMWNIRNEVLMGYAVLPVIRDTDEGDLYGHTVLGSSPDTGTVRALDTHMLSTQIATATELLPKNLTSLLVSQIHFDTLSSSTSRNEILQIAQKIPPYMKGNLMASIVDIPPSTPPSTLAQRISGLPKYFRAVSITIPNADFPVSACAAMGAMSVSYRVRSDLPKATVISEAKKIIAAAKTAKLLTVFEEVSDLNLAVALQKLGAVFITGTCLGGIDAAPGNMKQLTIKDVEGGTQTAA